MSAEELREAIRTRILDQCALDRDRLAGLCGGQADHSAELVRLERTLALRRVVKSVPLVGPVVRGIYRRVVSARRFGR